MNNKRKIYVLASKNSKFNLKQQKIAQYDYYNKLLADLRRKFHLSNGDEKINIGKYIHQLESIIKSNNQQKEQSMGFNVQYDDSKTPDKMYARNHKLITFIAPQKEPIYCDDMEISFDDEMISSHSGQILHMDILKNYIKEKYGKTPSSECLFNVTYNSIVRGRIDENTGEAYIWNTLTPECASLIKKYFPFVKTIYQSSPLNNTVNAIIKKVFNLKIAQ